MSKRAKHTLSRKKGNVANDRKTISTKTKILKLANFLMRSESAKQSESPLKCRWDAIGLENTIFPFPFVFQFIEYYLPIPVQKIFFEISFDCSLICNCHPSLRVLTLGSHF